MHNLSYPADSLPFEQMLDYVRDEVLKHVSQRDPIVLVGQSMGGVVSANLHRRNLNVVHMITIGSPLHGANLLNQLEAILPATVVNALNKPSYDYLKSKEHQQEPPHTYNTISMGWAWSNFDGCVYRNEATLDPAFHTHLSWMDHRTGFGNPRLWTLVTSLLGGWLTAFIAERSANFGDAGEQRRMLLSY